MSLTTATWAGCGLCGETVDVGKTTFLIDAAAPHLVAGDPDLSLLKPGIVIIPCEVPVQFEYDPAKSEANVDKHGIDFVAAQALWDDPMRVEVAARVTGEPRWLVIGEIGDRHWSAVVTYRDERVRLISVRRSREEEVAIYEG